MGALVGLALGDGEGLAIELGDAAGGDGWEATGWLEPQAATNAAISVAAARPAVPRSIDL